MVAMRNRLIHSYFDINLDIVWQTVQEDLPPADRRCAGHIRPGRAAPSEV